MAHYKYILAIDPAGNFNEGKGTTGICLFNTSTQQIEEVTNIAAKNFDNMYQYWQAHIHYILKQIATHQDNLVIVMEDYVLYSNKAADQINSRMETPKLIGLLQYMLYEAKTQLVMQLASSVKNRWSDKVLVHKNYLEESKGSFYVYGTQKKVSRHVKDAIRHAVHYATFYNKEGSEQS